MTKESWKQIRRVRGTNNDLYIGLYISGHMVFVEHIVSISDIHITFNFNYTPKVDSVIAWYEVLLTTGTKIKVEKELTPLHKTTDYTILGFLKRSKKVLMNEFEDYEDDYNFITLYEQRESHIDKVTSHKRFMNRTRIYK